MIVTKLRLVAAYALGLSLLQCSSGGGGSGGVGGAQSQPYCAGVVTPCSSVPATSCSSTLGCFTTGVCSGTPSPCATLSDSQCSYQHGCSSSLSSGCEGSPKACDDFGSQDFCEQQQGCSYSDGCTGTVVQCSELTVDECGLQAGCEIRQGAPPGAGGTGGSVGGTSGSGGSGALGGSQGFGGSGASGGAGGLGGGGSSGSGNGGSGAGAGGTAGASCDNITYSANAACQSCVEMNCCGELANCGPGTPCAAFTDCMFDYCAPEFTVECVKANCSAQMSTGLAPLQTLYACEEAACASACGG